MDSGCQCLKWLRRAEISGTSAEPKDRLPRVREEDDDELLCSNSSDIGLMEQGRYIRPDKRSTVEFGKAHGEGYSQRKTAANVDSRRTRL